MNALKHKKTYQILFLLGIPAIPLIEIYRSFWGDTLQIAGIAAEEALILLWAGIVFAAGAFFALKEKRHRLLGAVGAFLLVFFLYLFFHSLNAARFDASLVPNAAPSFLRECYYTVRMYLVPFCLIFASLFLALSLEDLKNALKGAAWIIALSIVITDLLGISYASYADGNVVVEGGFFSWFSLTDQSKFELYTAKGPFLSANDMAGILFALTPAVGYDALRRGKWHDFTLLALVGLASVMVGTKISTLGFFLALIGMLACAALRLIFIERTRKEWILWGCVLCVGLCLLPVFFLSPGYSLQNKRAEEAEEAYRPTDSVTDIQDVTENPDGELTPSELDQLAEYLEENHWNHFINPWFLEIYPVEGDAEYWTYLITRPNHLNSDTRTFKVELARRVAERNGGKWDSLLGIGNGAGLPYAEKDYFFQYYLFGALGVAVLVLPFVLLCALGGIVLLLRLWKKKELLPLSAGVISLGAFLVTGYLAGHVFDTITCMYFLAFSSASLLAALRREG